MKKMFLATAAVALALSLPLAANALTINVGGNLGLGGGVNVDTSGKSLSVGGNGAVNGALKGGANDNNAVIKTLATTQSELDAVASVNDSSVVQIVKLGAAADTDAWAKAKADNARSTAALQAAISANAAFKAELSKKNIDVSAIVAADVTADGTLILYTAS